MATVIIPAHNEEAVIERCLSALGRADSSDLHVIVVCNACSDETASIATSVKVLGLHVRVIELVRPGKVEAITAGDRVAPSFPRIVLDADVSVSRSSIDRLIAAVQGPGVLVGGLTPAIDTTSCSWLVRKFFQAWEKHPNISSSYVGAGIYALSEDGHQAVMPLPIVIADDEYINRSFPDDAKVVLSDTVQIVAPRTMRWLIRRNVRVRAGNRQLDALGLGRAVPSAGFLVPMLGSVGLTATVIFAATQLLVRTIEAYQRRRGISVNWAQDRSSRTK